MKAKDHAVVWLNVKDTMLGKAQDFSNTRRHAEASIYTCLGEFAWAIAHQYRVLSKEQEEQDG